MNIANGIGCVMQEKLISVIVPVYNVEKFLFRCLDSIVKQTYKKLEIILVDDGSTDNSGALCDEWAKRDGRIRVIHQVNEGQIGARIRGIKISSGDFIGFVDSDDWIESDMYEFLLREIGNADLATCGIFRTDSDGNLIECLTDLLDEGSYSSEIEMKILFENLIIAKNYGGGSVVGGISNNNVSKLFRASLAKKLIRQASVHVRYGEDLLFNILYILKCRSIKISHRCLYHYIDNKESVSYSCCQNFLAERDVFYNIIYQALLNHPCEKILVDQFQRRFLFFTISDMPSRMGFPPDISIPAFYPPFPEKLFGKKVVLFGAGKVGHSYAKWIRAQNIAQIAVWVDNKPIGDVKAPQEILCLQYDYVLVAVKQKSAAESITAQLADMGVKKDAILWSEPVNVLWKFLGFNL